MNIVAQLIRSFKPEVKIIKDFNVEVAYKENGDEKNINKINYYVVRNNNYYNILVYNHKVLKFNLSKI